MFPWLTRDEVFRIETPRLWLRWPRREDADALQAITAVAAVAEMTATWPHPLPDGEALRRIEGMRATSAAGGGLALAMALKGRPGELIGVLGCHAKLEPPLGLGYLLSVEHHGRGLMTEAVGALMTAVFTYTGHRLVRGSSRIINPASRRVLEKCGFRQVGRRLFETKARGGAIEVDDFELSLADWRSTVCGRGRSHEHHARHQNSPSGAATSDAG